MRRYIMFFVSCGLAIALLAGLFINSTAQSDCQAGESCTFPLSTDTNCKFNMVKNLTDNGSSWTIEAHSTSSFIEQFRDFSTESGYLFVYGSVGGCVCDVASWMNYVLVQNGLETAHDEHIIKGVYYAVAGVPRKDSVVIFDWGLDDPRNQDLTVPNPFDYPITLNWSLTDTEVTFWVDKPGQSHDSVPVIEPQEATHAIIATPKIQFRVEGGIAYKVKPTRVPNVLDKMVAPILPFQIPLIFITAFLAIVAIGSFIFSGSEMQKVFSGVLLASLVIGVCLFAFSYEGAKAASPPREAGFSFELKKPSKFSFELKARPTATMPSESSPVIAMDTISSADCPGFEKVPDRVRQWCLPIISYAAYYGADPLLIAAIITQESGGQATIHSYQGAIGLMQIMASDGISAGFMCFTGPCFADRPTVAQLEDPDFNLEYGIGFFTNLVGYYGSYRDALLHYGPSGIEYYYADIVLSIYDSYK